MADNVSRQKRSEMMSGIRGTDTKPELIIRSALHRLGYRFKLHDRTLPGSPDLVLPKYNSIIQIHGCFWHGHDCHLFKWPSTRAEFWRQKITDNRQRDKKNLSILKDKGWRVLVIWECAMKGKLKLPYDEVISRTSEWLHSECQELQIVGR